MSDTEQPAVPPAPAPEPKSQQRPERGPRPFKQNRPERGPRPPAPASRPPALTEEQGFMGKASKIRDLDAAIERELEEALGGFSAKEALGESEKGRPKEAQPGEGQGDLDFATIYQRYQPAPLPEPEPAALAGSAEAGAPGTAAPGTAAPEAASTEQAPPLPPEAGEAGEEKLPTPPRIRTPLP